LDATSDQVLPAAGGTFSSGGPLYGATALAANTWSHLAATYDGTALRMFVNGVQVSSRAQTGTIATSNGALTIGGDALYGQYFAGMIDEVRIYNRALSVAEVQVDMNTAVGSSSTPVNLWTPLVYAGSNITVDLANVAPLSGEAISNTPQGLTFTWSKVSGPGSVTYGNSHSLVTTAQFSATGVYDLMLTVSNTFATASDHVLVYVVTNNVEEVLATNSPLTLAEGATSTISSSLLSTTDADNTTAELVYTITSGPSNGTVRLSGSTTATFTQANINAGQVTYQHSGGETTSDSFSFTVNDGQGPGTGGTFSINVTQVNDEQVLSINSLLSVAQGATVAISPGVLTTTDADNTPTQLNYTVTSGPSKGTVLRSGTSTTTFTQADVNAGLVSYRHNGGPTGSDSFSFTVNDGQGTSTSGTFNVNVSANGGSLPALPLTYLDTTIDPAYNRPADIFVAAGGNLQAALNAALPGQIVELQAGATFTGNFTLPNKSGNAWIYIRTSDYANLPAPGTRVGPADTSHMARLRSTNTTSLVLTNSNAHNFRFVGIEFESTYAATDVNYNIIRLQNGADNIFFDRVYIHGSTTGNTYDGISADGIGRLAVVDSYIAEIHVAQNQEESHGIQIVGAVGPIKIENNYISAAGENILIGDNNSHASISADITIRGNHFYKPTSWKNAITSGPNAGLKWIVKNLLELKEGSRVLIEGNLFENNWQHSQAGYGILFTPRGGSVSDVTFRNNVIKGSERGFQITPASNTLGKVLLENNLIYGNTSYFLNSGNFGSGAVTDFTIRHNTVIGDGTVFLEGSTPVVNGWTVYDNIMTLGYGVAGTGTGAGLPTVTVWTQNYDWNNNVIVGAGGFTYGENSQFHGFRYSANNGSVGFTNSSLTNVSDFLLTSSSPYKNAGTDGKDIGADINAILAAMSGLPVGAAAVVYGPEDGGSGAASAGSVYALSAALVSDSPISESPAPMVLAEPVFTTSNVGVDNNLLEGYAASFTAAESPSTVAFGTLSSDDRSDEADLLEQSVDSAIIDSLFADDWHVLSLWAL
jgi:hypothetical protein